MVLLGSTNFPTWGHFPGLISTIILSTNSQTRRVPKLFRSGPLLNYCSRLPSIIHGQYFDMCIESVTDTGKNTSSLESVLLYSDYCMKNIKPSPLASTVFM